MKKIIFTTFLCLVVAFSIAQKTDTIKKPSQIMTVIEKAPKFLDGDIIGYIHKAIKYPEKAIQNGEEGKVFVEFTITKEGKITNVHVVRGVSKELDAEAVRVVSLMKNWEPGRDKKGVKNSIMTVPVTFKLY